MDIVKHFVEHCAPSMPKPVEGWCLSLSKANRKGRKDLRKVHKEGFFSFFKFFLFFQSFNLSIFQSQILQTKKFATFDI